ncbi:hypothetical protein B0H13DRAFT_2660750 [Mycena leptocephala]|nr:hypothetical protein B0H13DRAFT_2660750 [Mycena leptocephala]
MDDSPCLPTVPLSSLSSSSTSSSMLSCLTRIAGGGPLLHEHVDPRLLPVRDATFECAPLRTGTSTGTMALRFLDRLFPSSAFVLVSIYPLPSSTLSPSTLPHPFLIPRPRPPALFCSTTIHPASFLHLILRACDLTPPSYPPMFLSFHSRALIVHPSSPLSPVPLRTPTPISPTRRGPYSHNTSIATLRTKAQPENPRAALRALRRTVCPQAPLHHQSFSAAPLLTPATTTLRWEWVVVSWQLLRPTISTRANYRFSPFTEMSAFPQDAVSLSARRPFSFGGGAFPPPGGHLLAAGAASSHAGSGF